MQYEMHWMKRISNNNMASSLIIYVLGHTYLLISINYGICLNKLELLKVLRLGIG